MQIVKYSKFYNIQKSINETHNGNNVLNSREITKATAANFIPKKHKRSFSFVIFISIYKNEILLQKFDYKGYFLMEKNII